MQSAPLRQGNICYSDSAAPLGWGSMTEAFSWNVFHEQHWPNCVLWLTIQSVVLTPAAPAAPAAPGGSLKCIILALWTKIYFNKSPGLTLHLQVWEAWVCWSLAPLHSVCKGSGRKTFIVSVITHVYYSCHQKEIFPTLFKPVLSKCISCRNFFKKWEMYQHLLGHYCWFLIEIYC